MSDVKRLLDEATPLPWRYKSDAIYAGDERIGHFGECGSHLRVEAAMNARTAVLAVNRLPDYEAAVEALEWLIKTWDAKAEDTIGENVLALGQAIEIGRTKLRRLREGVPA